MRVGPVVLLAAALVATACGSGKHPRVAAPGTTTTAAGAPAATAPPLPGAHGGTTTTATRGATSRVTTTTGAPVGTTAPAATSLAATGPAGSFAPAYLRPALSSAVIVEVLAESGLAPRTSTLDHLTSVLRQVTGKPVDVVGPEPITESRQEWTGDAVRAAADRAATVAQGHGRAVLRLLFVHGSWAESSGDAAVLGISVRGDVSAIFADEVRSSASPFGAGALEDAVVVHEAGHLLGLVDLYLQTGRQDPEHPGHSTDPHSVMYWAVESSLVGDVLTGGPPRDFDAADLADLARIRAG